MATKYFSPKYNDEQFHNANGNPLAGGKIHAYAAGTSTPQSTYQDNAGAVAHSNPIVLSADGHLPAPIWLTASQAYKFILKTSADVTIETVDNIIGVGDLSAIPVGVEWSAASGTPTQTAATTFTMDGDWTSTLHPGRRLRFTDGTFKYGGIGASVYDIPTQKTTVTVALDGGASLTGSLSKIEYGIVSGANTSGPPDPAPGFTLGDGAVTVGRGHPRTVQMTPTASRDVTFDNSFGKADWRCVQNLGAQNMVLKANDGTTILTLPGGGSTVIVSKQAIPTGASHWTALVDVVETLTVTGAPPAAPVANTLYKHPTAGAKGFAPPMDPASALHVMEPVLTAAQGGIAAGALEGWHEVGAASEPAFENSWVNFGAGDDTAAFRKTADGVVFIKGTVKLGTVGFWVFTLPVGYRPSGGATTQKHFATRSNGAYGGFFIEENGKIWVAEGSNVKFSLSCSFIADN